MKFVIYSDFHFYHSWPEFNPLLPSGQTRWLALQIDAWRQVNEAANRLGAKKLFGGDLLHKRSYIHQTVMNAILKLYRDELKVDEFMIGGNHDRFDQFHNAVDGLDGLFGGAPILKVLRNGEHISIKDIETQKAINIYGANPGDTPPEIVTPGQFNILLAHGALNGAKSSSGFEMEGGYNLGDFAAFDFVVLGDIHAKQLKGNVLIPGATLQHSWGDTDLECGYWVYDTETREADFFPIKGPKFINVTQDNLEQVLSIEKDDFNYYDFKLTEHLDRATLEELRERFPNSYISMPSVERKTTKVIINKENTQEEIFRKYYEARINGDQLEEFVKEGLEYMRTASPKQISGGHKNLEILGMGARNFMCFEDIKFDFSKLDPGSYLVTGSSDEETTVTNSIGKSAFSCEIISFTLFDKLSRSGTRSKDRIIFDPTHTGKGKDLLTWVHLKINQQEYIIQRYRKHSLLGSGVRILIKE